MNKMNLNNKGIVVIAITIALLFMLSITALAEEPIQQGCTKSFGYWRTHSIYGPSSKYDDTWDDREDTDFFTSGFTWFEVTHMPTKGNSYILLAKQYIATQLNFETGADPSDILTSFGQATVLLSTYNPAYDWKEDVNNVKTDFINLAGLLKEYNAGITGPGLCN